MIGWVSGKKGVMQWLVGIVLQGQEVKQWLENKLYTVWLSSDNEFPVGDSDTLPVGQQSEFLCWYSFSLTHHSSFAWFNPHPSSYQTAVLTHMKKKCCPV